MSRRRWYVNEGLTEEGERRLREAVRLRVCPYHWTPLPPRKKVWCGKGEPVDPENHSETAEAWSCYWAFHLDPRWSRIKDWATVREEVLARDGGKCVNCGASAVEVDHIVEIQDGGAEFDLSNLRSLCHGCHVRKTVARRRFGPGIAVERALRARSKPLEAPT